MTPNMTFTKTSQKFGQWADHRVNTIYGLGFSSEVELTKVRCTLLLFLQLRLSARAPYNVHCSYSAKQLVSEVGTREQMCLEHVFERL